MELGQYQLQIFIGLVVVLAAAFVALICDFLKGNNEQLRELTIELKVRREEEQRRSQMMTAQTIPATAPAVRERMRMERVENERAEQRIEAPVARAMAAPEKKERKRPPSSDALAAMERGAALASAPRKRTAAPPIEQEAAPAEIEVPRTEENVPEFVQTPSFQPAAAASAPRQVTLVARQTSAKASNGPAKKDWGSLLARKPVTSMQSASQPFNTMQHDVRPTEFHEDLSAVAATTTPSVQPVDAAVPTGFHEGYILSRLVQSRQPVSGLVVSIGVNTPRNSDGSMPEPVRNLMQSLIGPGDFACQSSSEEFLLIYPNERGASAQRRLSEIAAQLWDFQLRSMGSFSILFSWGGVEVRSESIDEAIASANERMHETRRGRKLLTMEPRGEQQLRQAV